MLPRHRVRQHASPTSVEARRRAAVAGLLAVGLALACAPRAQPCREDADCGAGLCIEDLDRGDSYCSDACDSDADCEQTRRCAELIKGAPGDEDLVTLCIERVRSCGDEEPCNGLDDDCNGGIDDDCSQMSCVDDVGCGGVWPCAPSRDAASPGLVCRAPLPGGGAVGAACGAPEDCYNDLCEVGICAPLCRDDGGCPADLRCAAPSSAGAPSPHSSCHLACDAVTPCPSGLVCTLRPFARTCSWRAVCTPVRGAADYGDTCAGHDDCASALCVQGRCTRPCASSYDCQGLWTNARCEPMGLSPDVYACPLIEVVVCR